MNEYNDEFYELINELVEEMPAGFVLTNDPEDSSTDTYAWEHETGTTMLKIDYKQTLISISHTNTGKDRTINVAYLEPDKRRVPEIAECINNL